LQALKEEIAQVQLCSKLEALLLRKKSLSNGDSPKLHAEKVSFICWEFKNRKEKQ
jgi:hypothetical protein